MPQEVLYRSHGVTWVEGEAAAVTVPAASLTTLATIAVNGRKLLCLHFDVATQALDDFDVLAKAHSGGTDVDFTPANWAALPSGSRFRRTNGDLAAVAAAAKGYVEMDVDGLYDVTVKASAAANNAAVTPRWKLY